MSPIVVLFGGPSDERRVSVATAQHVLTVLDQAEPWFVGLDGRVYRPSREELQAHRNPFTTELQPRAAPAHASIEAALDDRSLPRDTVFFLGVHGSWGEDGTLQRLLEERKLAFTGSGSKASRDAFDKSAARRIVAAAGVRTAEARELPRTSASAIAAALREMHARHGRAVAKPVAGGSSVGLHHIRGEADADKAAEAIARAPEAYLCEAFISGTELTIGVVQGPGGLRALPASEVRVDPGRAFDYEGKYLGKGTVEITPAEVPAPISQAAQQLALTAHAAIGCYGYSRTDVIVDAKGPVFLETNTLPGLTRASFVPQQLAVEGTPMKAFLEGQLELARKRRG
jgi:D-alanine-D-alanine ligase